MHHALILIRHKCKHRNSNGDVSDRENDFWDKVIDTYPDPTVWTERSKTVFYSKDQNNIGADNKIQCYLVVENEWYLPNECPHCFPDFVNIVDEKPLILANRTSVVPKTMIGIKGDVNNSNCLQSLESDLKTLAPLCNTLCYGHIIRDQDNHFEYYFQTDEVLRTVLESDEKRFEKTFKDFAIKETETEDGVVSFDYVVAPLHSTNADFVYRISQYLKAKQIIRLDVKREFRDNIKTKFSDVRAIYDNCILSAKLSSVRSIIRFHFVDDTINSGTSFYRVKSLIASLFPELSQLDKYKDKVELKVFQSIFLLINRCSKNTQASYVNPKNYHYYINLSISSMRSYNDACVACKNLKNFKEILPLCSATSDIAREAILKSKKFEKREIEKIQKPIDMILPSDAEAIAENRALNEAQRNNEIKLLQKRNFYRLVLTHRMNERLGLLGKGKNNNGTVKNVIWQLLDEVTHSYNAELSFDKKQKCVDLLFSALKIISRPFLSFRKSVSEASLSILLNIADYSVNKHTYRLAEQPALANFINIYCGENIQNRVRFYKLLFSCLASLHSTFLLRSSTIKAVLNEYNNIVVNDYDLAKNFRKDYVFYVKQVLCLSGKGTLSHWFEQLLTEAYDAENKIITIQEKFPIGDTKFVCSDDASKQLWKLLLLENTAPIYEALVQCHKAWMRGFNAFSESLNKKTKFEKEKLYNKRWTDIVKETLRMYFCKTYAEFSRIGLSNGMTVERFIPMLKLYDGLQKKENDEKAHYEHLLNHMKQILNCSTVQLFVHLLPDEKSVSFPNGGTYHLYGDYDSRKDDVSQELSNYVKSIAYSENAENLGDTLFYKKTESDCMGAIKIVDTFHKGSGQKDGGSEYYLAFELQTPFNDLEFILKMRNLLVMRGYLMERLISDFDSNIGERFIQLTGQVKCLGNDRAGAHSPFEELSEVFDDIVDHINANTFDELSENDQIHFINCAKVIADAVVSKLYVHSIVGTFPTPVPPEKMREDGEFHDVEISYYMKLMKLLLKGRTSDGSSIMTFHYKSEILIKTEIINCPFNCDFIWCCAVIALFFNALTHGRPEDDCLDLEWKVLVKIFSEDNSIIFKNKMLKSHIEALNNLLSSEEKMELKTKKKVDHNMKGVTIDALRYYFDHYYGVKQFNETIFFDNNDYYYQVRIPCKPNWSENLEKTESIYH